LLSPYLAKE